MWFLNFCVERRLVIFDLTIAQAESCLHEKQLRFLVQDEITHFWKKLALTKSIIAIITVTFKVCPVVSSSCYS